MSSEDATPTQVILLECNLDDMTGEALGYALERILVAGALDVWYTPIYAKKNRPAVLLSVLCRVDDQDRMTAMVLTETSSLGVRRRKIDRIICARESITVDTPWGPVSCKVKKLGGRVLNVKPEYEDCARLASEYDLSLEQVTERARSAAWDRVERDDIV